MIVPQYWAEGRIQHKKAGKQVTMRRFGWSDESQKAAQEMADARTEEALQKFLTGEKLEKYEPKMAYNGADGVPIREEIVDRLGENVLTRNSYGALCINSPDVFFIDVDFSEHRPFRYLTRAIFFVFVILSALAYWNEGRGLIFYIAISSTGILPGILAGWIRKAHLKMKGGHERVAMGKIESFTATRLFWNLRIYRTPNGLRLLAAHRTFSPADPEVEETFEALGSDPMYRMMCLKQQCFRARVSPKPWRIGIGNHLRPRPGVWPVKPKYLPARNEWIVHYEKVSKGFSSCNYLETRGNGKVHPAIAPVMEWHDELCRAESGLPSA